MNEWIGIGVQVIALGVTVSFAFSRTRRRRDERIDEEITQLKKDVAILQRDVKDLRHSKPSIDMEGLKRWLLEWRGRR